MKSKVLLKSYLLIMVSYLCFYHFLPDISIVAQTYNPYPECPPNSDHIWVRLDEDQDGIYELSNIPFEVGYDTTDIDGPGPDKATGYINYVAGVLFGEVSPTNHAEEDETVTFNDEFLRGFAMLVRTVAIENCKLFEDDDLASIDGTIKQNYDPDKLFGHLDLADRYLQAVTDTAGQFVTYNGDVFDLQYRNISNSPTNDVDHIHQSVLDPAGIFHPNSKHQAGLPQINASHILQGVAHGAYFPRWNFCQTHAHYYNGISFPCPHTSQPLPTDYRFNIITMTVTDRNGNRPPLWQAGSWQTVGLILQNSGQLAWELTSPEDCTPTEYEQRTIALASHWYQPNGTLVEFESNREVLCAELVEGTLRTTILPGDLYPNQASQGDDVIYWWPSIWVPNNLNPGLYEVWLDVELRHPHPTQWISRLHPTTNPNEPHWFPQALTVRVGWGSPNPPEEPTVSLLSNHQVGVWSNQATVEVGWEAVSEATNYAYTWRHNQQVDPWQETSATDLQITLTSGAHTFSVQALNHQGDSSPMVEVGPVLIDTIPPTVTLFPLPALITNPLTTDLSFAWWGNDVGGSGLFFEVAYDTQPFGVEPLPIPLEANIPQTTSTRLNLSDLGLTLQAGQAYQVWVRGRDGAGNFSPWRSGYTHYQPEPLLHIQPMAIQRYYLYNQTNPLTTTLNISNLGGGVLTWTISSSVTWTHFSQTEGFSPATTVITFTPTQTPGLYQANLLIYGGDHTLNSPYTLPVTLYALAHVPTIYLPLLIKD